MISGQLTLQGFAATVSDGEMAEVGKDGKPTGKKFPLKVLVITDAPSGTQLQLAFSPDQFEAFVEQLQKASSKIVKPVPPLRRDFKLPWLTRNGGIRQ